MIGYPKDMAPGPLTPWPFDNPESDYVIREGTPKASGRLDAGGPGHPTRLGIWHCTKGIFDCTEQGDEMMTILWPFTVRLSFRQPFFASDSC